MRSLLLSAILLGCTPTGTEDSDTGFGETDDSDVVDTDVGDTDDTDVEDTDVEDTDVVEGNDDPIPFAEGFDLADGAVSGLSAMAAADFDGDGQDDIITMEGGKHASGRVTFRWYEAPADPAADAWPAHPLTRPDPLRPFIGAVKAGDVDGDGDPDIVWFADMHSGGTRLCDVRWLENPGGSDALTEAWTVHDIATSVPVHHVNDIELEDFDGDGRLDVVGRSLSPNRLLFWFQDRSGWTAREIDTEAFGDEGLEAADIDGDGDVDLTLNGWWIANPDDRDGTWEDHGIETGFSAINQNTKEAAGDLDGDGDIDVVISAAEAFRGGKDHVLAWYENPGDPTTTDTWTRHILEQPFNDGHTVQVGDLDGDGDPDIVSGIAWGARRVHVYVNQGGRFGPATAIATGRGLYSGVLADVDGDGFLDVIGQDAYSGSSRPWVYLNAFGG